MASQAKVAAIYVELQANTAKFRAALHEAEGATKQFRHSTVSNTQAASAAIRLMEGDVTNLVRAAERFVGQSQVLSGVLKTAFPVIGAVAIASVIGEGIKRVTDFIEKARQVPKALEDAFQASNLSITQTNDQLQKSNDELANQIAKLEGKPQNNLSVAIDDARLKADALAKSLGEDNKQLQELLKTQSVGFFAALTTGQMPTGHSADLIKSWSAELKRRANNVVIAQHQFGVGSAEDKTAEAELAKTQKDAEAAVKKHLDDLQATLKQQTTPQVSFAVSPTGGMIQQGTPVAPGGPDLAANINMTKGYLAQLYGRDNESALQQTNTQEKAKVDVLQHANELAAAQKAAQELLLKQDEASLEEMKHQKEMWSQAWTPRDDEAFWESHIGAFTKGSDAYNKVQKTIWADQVGFSKNLAESYKAILASQTEAARMDAEYTKQQAKAADNGTDQLAGAAARAQVVQARIQADATLAQAKLRAVFGQISPQALAQTESTAHAAEYQEQLQALQQQLNELHQNDFGSLSAANTAKEVALQSLIDQLQAKAKIQAMEDAQNEFNNTWKGSIASIYDTVIEKSQQTMEQVQRISAQFVDGINTELAKAMTGQRTNFSGVFIGAAQGLAKSALQKLEGAALGALGFGKRDGSTASQALWVQVASNGTALSGLPDFSGIANGLPKIVGPNGQSSLLNTATGVASKGFLSMLNNSNFFSSLFGGRLFGAGGFFGGHFATGGDVTGGVPIDVGELGPERFVPYTNGRIVPHNELNNSRGPSIGYIDARGTDPAQTQAAVMRGMQIAHAQSVKDATRVIAERQRRMPH